MQRKPYMDDYNKREQDFYMNDCSKETYEEISSYMEEANKHAENREYKNALNRLSKALAAANFRKPGKNIATVQLTDGNVDTFINDAKNLKSNAVYANHHFVDYYFGKLSVYQF